MKKFITLLITFCCAVYINAQWFDFTDLYAPNVKCTTGDFYTPYASIGVVPIPGGLIASRREKRMQGGVLTILSLQSVWTRS